MEVKLLYFSGTGATAKMAQIIGATFRNLTFTVTYERIKRDGAIEIGSCDVIGIGAPAYSFRAPRIVTHILRSIDWRQTPFFLFCTSGGMPGNTLRNLYDAVKQHKGRFLGAFATVTTTNLRSWMPHSPSASLPHYNFSSFQTSHIQEFVRRIYHSLPESIAGEPPPSRSLGLSIWSLLFTWRWQMALTPGIKRINKQKCNQCGLCAKKICPSHAITWQKGHFPHINECLCVGCNGCVNLCPQDAVWSWQTRHHIPYTTFRDSILQDP